MRRKKTGRFDRDIPLLDVDQTATPYRSRNALKSAADTEPLLSKSKIDGPLVP
jgi:hypothetical protein